MTKNQRLAPRNPCLLGEHRCQIGDALRSLELLHRICDFHSILRKGSTSRHHTSFAQRTGCTVFSVSQPGPRRSGSNAHGNLLLATARPPSGSQTSSGWPLTSSTRIGDEHRSTSEDPPRSTMRGPMGHSARIWLGPGAKQVSGDPELRGR